MSIPGSTTPITQENLINFFRTNPPERALPVVKKVLANPDLDQKVKIIAFALFRCLYGHYAALRNG